jgi:hypothetical protein
MKLVQENVKRRGNEQQKEGVTEEIIRSRNDVTEAYLNSKDTRIFPVFI